MCEQTGYSYHITVSWMGWIGPLSDPSYPMPGDSETARCSKSLAIILDKSGSYSFMKTGVLKRATIPWPPVPLQGRFALTMAQVDGAQVRRQAALAAADDLFNSLAQRAFKGEL